MTKAHNKIETNENQRVKKPYQSSSIFQFKMGNQNSAVDHHKNKSPNLSTIENLKQNQKTHKTKDTTKGRNTTHFEDIQEANFQTFGTNC